MTKTFFCGGLFLLAVLALPNPAAADPISCPENPNVGDNVYTVDGTGTTTAVDCVSEYGEGTLNGQTGNDQDDFLNGPNDDGSSQYFQPGGDWTSF